MKQLEKFEPSRNVESRESAGVRYRALEQTLDVLPLKGGNKEQILDVLGGNKTTNGEWKARQEIERPDPASVRADDHVPSNYAIACCGTRSFKTEWIQRWKAGGALHSENGVGMPMGVIHDVLYSSPFPTRMRL